MNYNTRIAISTKITLFKQFEIEYSKYKDLLNDEDAEELLKHLLNGKFLKAYGVVFRARWNHEGKELLKLREKKGKAEDGRQLYVLLNCNWHPVKRLILEGISLRDGMLPIVDFRYGNGKANVAGSRIKAIKDCIAIAGSSKNPIVIELKKLLKEAQETIIKKEGV